MMIAFGSSVEEIKTEFTSAVTLLENKKNEQRAIQADRNRFLNMSDSIQKNI